MGNEPIRLKDALSQVGRQLGLRAPAEAALVFSRWDRIVGRTIAEHVRPTSLRGGVLRICADSSVWATEVSYLHDEIKQRANEAAGTRVISEVKVWTGKGDDPAPKGAANQTPAAPDHAAPTHSDRSPAEDPDKALKRARKAWSEARERTRREASENPERRR